MQHRFEAMDVGKDGYTDFGKHIRKREMEKRSLGNISIFKELAAEKKAGGKRY